MIYFRTRFLYNSICLQVEIPKFVFSVFNYFATNKDIGNKVLCILAVKGAGMKMLMEIKNLTNLSRLSMSLS